MNIDDLSTMLDELKIEHNIHISNGIKLIHIIFETQNFIDIITGNHEVSILVALEENGEFLKVASPSIYICLDQSKINNLFPILLQIQWNTKMINYSYNSQTGEIRAGIEMCLEDAVITKRQLERIVRSLALIIDENDPEIQNVLQCEKVL